MIIIVNKLLCLKLLIKAMFLISRWPKDTIYLFAGTTTRMVLWQQSWADDLCIGLVVKPQAGRTPVILNCRQEPLIQLILRFYTKKTIGYILEATELF